VVQEKEGESDEREGEKIRGTQPLYNVRKNNLVD